MTWDPQLYARFDTDRSRPFFDLTARIRADAPDTVVDLGCGTGALTAMLARRWPGAAVTGIDSSPDMVAAAPGDGSERLDIRHGDLRDFQPEGVDVVVSNAALQWIPEHRGLLRRWAAGLPSGAWLAWQVPGNFDAPSHALMRQLADSPRWSGRLGGVLRGGESVDDPAGYARLLVDADCTADVWETTYVHLLNGENPVLQWVRATGLRPVLDALDADAAADFEAEYAALLRDAYPAGPHGTLFPFRRVFCVGRKR
ncbi:trans-aconitate 2-methyltransferase [Murinocardiopsis flavida]|nr:trans-aconitate 2-methyltransferase [Murinocardiopsis flavida]